MAIRHALISALLACVLLAGCGAREANVLPLDDVEAMSTAVMKQLDSQRPLRAPDFFGKVEKISGNTVTLALAEMPPALLENPAEKAPNKSGQQGPPQNNPGQRDKRKGMQLTLTGKTKDIIFTNETKIVRFYRDTDYPCLQALTIKDIAKGNILSVWVQDNRAVYVQVSRRRA